MTRVRCIAQMTFIGRHMFQRDMWTWSCSDHRDGWVFDGNQNNHQGNRSREQDHVHMPLWNIFLPTNVVWAMQCTCIVPKVHDVHFLRYDWGSYGSLHGWFFSLWNNLWSLSRKFGQSLAEMPRKGPDHQLGEMPFYGSWRHRLTTLGVRERDRGG